MLRDQPRAEQTRASPVRIVPDRIALAVLLAAAAGRAYARSRGPSRRARLPALAAALALAAVLTAGGVAALVGVSAGAEHAELWAYDAVIVLVAALFALDLARGRWNEATVTGLVVDLGDVPEEGVLRERLAAALGDRTLALGFWSLDEEAFLDGSGRRLEPAGGSGKRGDGRSRGRRAGSGARSRRRDAGGSGAARFGRRSGARGGGERPAPA